MRPDIKGVSGVLTSRKWMDLANMQNRGIHTNGGSAVLQKVNLERWSCL